MEAIVLMIVLAFPTYFLLAWTFKKISLNNELKKILTVTGTLVLTPAIFFGLTGLLIFSTEYYSTKRFDKNKWIANEDKRYEMTQDLIASKILMGKTKEQVVALLGDADTTTNIVTYYVGYKPALIRIDPDMIDIEFKDNKVVAVTQRQS